MTFCCHRIFSCTEMFFVKHRNRPSQKPPRVLGFQIPSNSLPLMSCGVYAEGETDHSGLFSVLTHARHWHIGAAGPEELGQICHTSQPQPSLMHIPSKCTRAIVNRVSLYHRGTMRVEILARSFLTNPKGFSDRVQMCVCSSSDECFVGFRLCNCAFTVLTRPPTTPQHRDSNLNMITVLLLHAPHRCCFLQQMQIYIFISSFLRDTHFFCLSAFKQAT